MLKRGLSARRLCVPRMPAVAVLCAALLLLGGCSALRVGYNQADWVAYAWLDRYVGFDDAQAKGVREALTGWFSWHRKTQLADYQALLLQIEADVHADVTPERTCGHWSAVRTRVDVAAARAVPAIARLAPTLKPAQLESIERRYAKTNAEYRTDFMQTDRARRSVEAAKRAVSRAESLYGELDVFQREKIERFAADSPFDPELAFEERRRRQQDALQTLRKLAEGRVEGAAAEAEVRAWIERIGRSPREAYRQQSARVLQHNCRLAADIHNITSPVQRRTASAKLKGWAADLRALATDSAD